jgi:nicotinate-nucleotide adenylyltransferase
MREQAPIGIFGGTFDPVHLGHLRLAEEAADQLNLAGIRWLPAGQPKHRQTPQVSPIDRLRMVQLATAGNPRFSVDAAEVDSGEASYTVPSLERLRHKLGSVQPLILLLGADAYAGLPSWHRWQEIFSLAHIAIAHRPGFALDIASLPTELAAEHKQRFRADPDALATTPGGQITSFAMTPLAVSATQVRSLLAAGRSLRYLLPQPVIDYIALHNLYRNNDGS